MDMMKISTLPENGIATVARCAGYVTGIITVNIDHCETRHGKQSTGDSLIPALINVSTTPT
jgi:hypothetical protein